LHAKRSEYEHRNALEKDFDKTKVQGIPERYASNECSQQEDTRHVAALCTFFGNLALSHITRAHVETFKQARKKRRSYKGTPVSDAYCNRELATLRHMLKLALEEGLVETILLVRLHQEEGRQERTFSPEEYQRLLTVSPVHLRRIMTCAYETGMCVGEIKNLTGERIDMKMGFLRLAAIDTKVNEKRAIPISPALREVLDDIREEQREGKGAPIGGHVFTWSGKAMSEG
jgi:integrase